MSTNWFALQTRFNWFFWYLICGRVFPPCTLSIFTTFTFRGYMTMLTSCLEPVFAVDVLSCSWMNYTKLTVDKPLTLLCFSSYIVYVHCSEAFTRIRVEFSIKITILLYYLQTNWTLQCYSFVKLNVLLSFMIQTFKGI